MDSIDAISASDTDDPAGAPARRPRMTRSERRAVILSAARQEFARAGYRGASTANIARAAECSEPMLYKHFAGKQALFAATLEDVSDAIEASFDERIEEPGNLLDNLQSYLPRIMCDPIYVESLQLRMLAITVVDEPDIRASLNGIRERFEQRVDTAIRRQIEQGYVRADVDPLAVSWAWTGIMLSGCYRHALEPDGFQKMLPYLLDLLDSLRPSA